MEKVVFIGSSSESLPVAEEIAALLEELKKELKVEPLLWKDAFPPGNYTLESLENITNEISGAIFVFNEDDKILHGGTGTEIGSVRDNVIFEFGLFLGKMSRARVIIARSKEPLIPSDLLGITYLNILDDNKYTVKGSLRKWIKTLPTLDELSNLANAIVLPPQPTVSPQTSPSNPQKVIKIGSIETFGKRDWRVLDIQDGKALLLSEQIWDQRPYHRSEERITWENCTLRKELNDEFFKLIPQEVRVKIARSKISNNKNGWYGTDGGEDTDDNIFLLSLEEVDRYFGDSGDYANKKRKDRKAGKYILANNGYWFSNDFDKDRIAIYNGAASWWWLRSRGGGSNIAARVDDAGAVDVGGYGVADVSGGVRPALWLNL